jgi:hypothetical protein
MKILSFSLLVAFALVWTGLILYSFVWKHGFYENIDLMTETETTAYSLIILLFPVLVLWILARLKSRIRTLFLSSFAAFIIVFACLMDWWLDGVKFLEKLYMLIAIPGFMIAHLIAAQIDKIDRIAHLSNFEGPFFTIVMFFSSFIFYTAIMFAAIKFVSYLKKAFALKSNESKVPELFKKR